MNQQMRYVYLELLRGCAALLVMLEHIELLFESKLNVPIKDINGAVGVDIFFVISGFLMVHVSRNYEAGLGSARQFCVNRLSRILPLYWVLTLVYAAAYLAIGKTEYLGVEAFIKSLLFIPYGPMNAEGQFTPIIGVGWTLNYEMMFYAVFALLILPLGRRAAWGCMAVITAAILIEASLAPAGACFLPVHFLIKNPIAMEFVFGMMVGLLLRRQKPLLNATAAAVFAAIALAYLLLAAFVPVGGGEAKFLRYGLPSAVLVYSLVVLEFSTGNRMAADGWGTRTALYLGSLSYSIYLTHFLGLMIGVVVLKKLLGSHLESMLVLVPTIALTIVALMVLAHLASRWIELPLSAALKRMLSGERRPVAAGAMPGENPGKAYKHNERS